MKAIAAAFSASVILFSSTALAQDAGEPGAETKPTQQERASPVAASVDAGSGSIDVGSVSAGPPAPADARIALFELRQGEVSQSLSGRAIGLLGVLAMIGLAFVLSLSRKTVDWKLVAIGTALQFAFAFIVLKTVVGRTIFDVANAAITKLLSFSEAGSRFVFGKLADNAIPVGKPMFNPPELSPLHSSELWAQTFSMIAFRVLPTIIFFSALTAVLYHLGVLTRVVRALAWVMQRTMGTSGAESLSASANIFVGQTEAPLLVRPFLERMTRSELMCVMTAGFATVAGGVMAAYVGMLSIHFKDIAGHLLAASVMSAPAALVMAKIMVPEDGEPETKTSSGVVATKIDANIIDAAARGTTEGMMLAFNVGAMLISFLALIALINFGIGGIGGLFGFEGLTLEKILGMACAPIAFLLGTPWEDAAHVGALIGTKTVVNEFVAYSHLAEMLARGDLHHAKSAVIAAYALCGFSNFGSIGIQIGGLSALAPSRRADLARLGLRAMIAGTLACFQTAAIAAIVL